MNPYDVIMQCRQTASGNDKMVILKENDTPLLRSILKAALDPFTVYGVKKFEFDEPCEHTEGFDYNWQCVERLLVQLKSREVTGNAALEAIKGCSANLNTQQQEILRCILNRDLACGVSVKTVNKVYGDMIKVFEVQLAHPVDYDRIEYPCIAEPKLDGLRCLAFVRENGVTYYSRNGKEFENFGIFDKELMVLANGSGLVFEGEVIGADDAGDFKGIQKQARRKYGVDNTKLEYNVFDVMTIKEFINQNVESTQVQRTSRLKQMFVDADHDWINVQRVKFRLCHTADDIESAYRKYLDMGYEGTVIKAVDGVYEFKRSYSWMKVKPTETLDLKVVDMVEGRDQFKGMLGAFVVMHKKTKVNVGGGLSVAQRKSYWGAKKSMIGKIIEVKYDSITEDDSLRFPRFVKVRDDKGE